MGLRSYVRTSSIEPKKELHWKVQVVLDAHFEAKHSAKMDPGGRIHDGHSVKFHDCKLSIPDQTNASATTTITIATTSKTVPYTAVLLQTCIKIAITLLRLVEFLLVSVSVSESVLALVL